MEKEKATVWVTKYALRDGVSEQTGYIFTLECGSKVFEYSPFSYRNVLVNPEHWHRSKKEAIARAEQMRKAKLASLIKQIKKLQSLKFD